jgi:hypothetical protein
MEVANGMSEQVVKALRQNPIPALRRVSVQQTPEGIVLSGKVPSYYYKQLAQEAVMPHLMGRRLENHVVVVRHES